MKGIFYLQDCIWLSVIRYKLIFIYFSSNFISPSERHQLVVLFSARGISVSESIWQFLIQGTLKSETMINLLIQYQIHSKVYLKIRFCRYRCFFQSLHSLNQISGVFCSLNWVMVICNPSSSLILCSLDPVLGVQGVLT